MSKLHYRKVFSKYNTTLSDRLASIMYDLYKKKKTSKSHTQSEDEISKFEEIRYKEDASCAMPSGYNYSTQETEEGNLNLEYLDLFDFLPKENVDDFKMNLKKCISKNNLSFFSHYLSEKDDKRIDDIGTYMDSFSTLSLCTIELCHNKFLKQYAMRVTISLQNLSSSFLLVKYRFHIKKEFNDELNLICKSYYPPFSSVLRGVNISWYQPRKFAISFFTGNDARAKSLYLLVSKMKWKAYKELKRYFSFNFEKIQLFPPTFESFSTNIRPSNTIENRFFWQSIGLWHPDYSPKFNLCVNMRYECEPYEGVCFSAYCGGKYSNTDDHHYDLYQYYISDVYAVYIVASSIDFVAKSNLAQGNKQISKAIKKAKISSILKVRAKVEHNLYYSYRFISEFTGKTIDLRDVKEFRNPLYKTHDGSDTEWCLKNISKTTKETKKQVDTLFKILNDTAEYGNSKLNLKLQRLMMIVTFLSLIVAIMSMMGIKAENFKCLWDNFISFIKSLI